LIGTFFSLSFSLGAAFGGPAATSSFCGTGDGGRGRNFRRYSEKIRSAHWGQFDETVLAEIQE
jgi:hypothetical protein